MLLGPLTSWHSFWPFDVFRPPRLAFNCGSDDGNLWREANFIFLRTFQHSHCRRWQHVPIWLRWPFMIIMKLVSQMTHLMNLSFLSNYRFSPTRTPSPWDGIRKSDKFSAVCPQRLPNVQNEQEALKKMPKGRLEYLKRLLPFLQNQSEDCLYLNVFSPLHGKPNYFTLFIALSMQTKCISTDEERSLFLYQ